MNIEPSGVYVSLRTQPLSSPSYELSFGISLAMIGRLGAENNCVKQTT